MAVAHDRDLELLVGQLDVDRRELLVRFRSIGPEAAVNNRVHRWDHGDLTFILGSSEQGDDEACVDMLPYVGEVVVMLPLGGGDIEQAEGEQSELLLLGVGELLLGLHIVLESHQAVFVTLDCKVEAANLLLEAAQLLLEGSQGGVELVYLLGHRGKLVEMFKLLENLIHLCIRFRRHCASIRIPYS